MFQSIKADQVEYPTIPDGGVAETTLPVVPVARTLRAPELPVYTNPWEIRLDRFVMFWVVATDMVPEVMIVPPFNPVPATMEVTVPPVVGATQDLTPAAVEVRKLPVTVGLPNPGSFPLKVAQSALERYPDMEKLAWGMPKLPPPVVNGDVTVTAETTPEPLAWRMPFAVPIPYPAYAGSRYIVPIVVIVPPPNPVPAVMEVTDPDPPPPGLRVFTLAVRVATSV